MIVTADDFGLSHEANAAIAEALDARLVTHASIMANMPAFEEACELARKRAVLDRVGAHLVLTEGEPVTEAIRSCRRFCDEQGRFRYWRGDDHAFHLGRADRQAVEHELRAQILRCHEHALGLSHLDSHNHTHAKRAIGRVVIELAREVKVPRVRLAHNCGPRLGFANRMYKAFFNARLRRAGLAGTRWYGSVEDYVYEKASGRAPAKLDSFEVNVHPGFSNGVLVDLGHPKRPLEELASLVGWSRA